jgi:protein SCO1
MRMILTVLTWMLPLLSLSLFAQSSNPEIDPNRDVRFEQKLGAAVNPKLVFHDENGASVPLGNFFREEPVVVAMGYYQCPMLCGVVLNTLVQGLQDIPPASPDRHFHFVFVSIDPKETVGLANAKRREYLKRYGWEPATSRWHFLTGSESAIHELANEIGFHYRYDSVSRQYVHPSGLVFVTPHGRIASYLIGIQYPARDLANAIIGTRSERVSSPVQQLLLLCFSGKATGAAGVVLWVLRIGAVITVIALLALIIGSRKLTRGSAPPHSSALSDLARKVCK